MITDAFRLDGKVALITGASKGIGAGIASAFAEMGAHVALIARSEPELADVAAAVTEHGVTALPLACDITQDDALGAAVEKLESKFGRVKARRRSKIRKSSNPTHVSSRSIRFS